MTRDELIETMARAGIRADIQSEELARCVAAFMLSAIEAAGLCIVPVEATEKMRDQFWVVHDVSDSGLFQHGYRAMIDAGRL